VIHLLIQDPPQKLPPPWEGVPATDVDQFGQLPVLASSFDHVDGLFYFTYAVCIFFFVLITGVLLYSVVAHRRKTWDQPALSNVTHNTPLEVVWTVIPLIIVMVMFAWGFKGSLDMTTVPHAAARNSYKATAKQWNWTFTYPNDKVQSYGEVWVVADKPAQFYLESTDVLHAFYVPAMRVKRDVVPGRYQSVWFTPHFTREFAPGEAKVQTFHLFCAEYCGDDHSRMYAKLHVVDQATYDTRPWDQWPAEGAPVEEIAKAGGNLYRQLCVSCHSVDGSTVLAGPTWKGLFVKNANGEIVGRQREVIVNGARQTITVDDAYITESIQNPSAKIVAEPPYDKGGMTPFPDIEERKIKGIIEYMKSLAQ
jgi:cytochrome c oxidase subunit 2